MKVGDLVRDWGGQNTRIGVVTGDFLEEKELVWTVHFANVGQWDIVDSEFDTGEAILFHEV